MNTFGRYYQPDSEYSIDLRPGDYVCKIASAVEKTSKKGNVIVELKLLINNRIVVYYYLTENRSTPELDKLSNQNLTKFFDCFKIRRGNFMYGQWIGAEGNVRLGYKEADERGRIFLEVKKLLLPQNQNNIQPSHMNTYPPQYRPPQYPQGATMRPRQNEVKNAPHGLAPYWEAKPYSVKYLAKSEEQEGQEGQASPQGTEHYRWINPKEAEPEWVKEPQKEYRTQNEEEVEELNKIAEEAWKEETRNTQKEEEIY